MRQLSYNLAVFLFCAISSLPYVRGGDLMKDFDFQKFITKKWWVSYRAKKYKHYDRCIAISFGKFFKNKDYYVELDHEMSGSIDRSYHPVTPHDTGYHFKANDGEEGRVDFLETDYTSYAIAMLTLKDQAKDLDHVAIISTEAVPSPDKETEIGKRLQEVEGIPISQLEKVNNENCPVFEKV